MLMEKYEWGNLNGDIYLDETNIRMTMNFRNNFSRLAEQLISEDQHKQAGYVLDRCMELMPKEKVPLNYFIHPIVESYYEIQNLEKANTLVSELHEIYVSELDYFFGFPKTKIEGVQLEILKNLQFYNNLIEISSKYKHPNNDQIMRDFEIFYQEFLAL